MPPLSPDSLSFPCTSQDQPSHSSAIFHVRKDLSSYFLSCLHLSLVKENSVPEALENRSVCPRPPTHELPFYGTQNEQLPVTQQSLPPSRLCGAQDGEYLKVNTISIKQCRGASPGHGRDTGAGLAEERGPGKYW